MNIYIKPLSTYNNPIRYVLKLIEKNRNVQFHLVDNKEAAQLFWAEDEDGSQPLNSSFYAKLNSDSNTVNFRQILNKDGLITTNEGHVDYLTTIFYMVNCLQELNPEPSDLDRHNRFKYSSSYQSMGTITENIVEKLMDAFCAKHQLIGTKRKSTFFISHDIDTIYGSLYQDGFWAIKRMKLGTIMKLILLEISRRPHWKNIDKIVKINNEHDIRSTFFWLVNKGKGERGIMNADYSIEKERELLELVERSGNTNGLHKSCSEMSIDDELMKGKIDTGYNRYHFLNFQTHSDWSKISDSKLTFDCSLGFAEHYGFRNSYGRAFQPFDIEKNQPHDFVEAPLTFMDGTFHSYMTLPSSEASKTVIDLFEKNPENCDFSLLWHNTYFTDYKYNSYLDEYKKIVGFIYENKIETVSPRELIDRNRLEW